MTCTCVRGEVGFVTGDCEIHGPGGLRDEQFEDQKMWEERHPLRWAIHKALVRFRSAR